METKSIFAIMTNIECQIVELERARVLLEEAARHNEDPIDPDSWQARYYLISTKPVVSVLIDVAARLMGETMPVLDEATKELLEIHRKEKGLNHE